MLGLPPWRIFDVCADSCVVISAYVRIAWDVGQESIETEISRIQETAAGTGRSSLVSFSGFLSSVLTRRSEDPEKLWQWDDGLDARFYFS